MSVSSPFDPGHLSAEKLEIGLYLAKLQRGSWIRSYDTLISQREHSFTPGRQIDKNNSMDMKFSSQESILYLKTSIPTMGF